MKARIIGFLTTMVGVVLFLILPLGLPSCGGDSDPSSSSTLTAVEGGRWRGGVFKLNEPEFIKTLFPPNIIDAYSYRVAAQIYEGLFKFDQSDLSVKPALCEKYEVDASNTVYTFTLRQKVFFHDNPAFPDGVGREMKAADVAYCFSRLCNGKDVYQGSVVFLDVVKGARDYFNATRAGEKPSGVSGIKVTGDYTLEITLERPSSVFLFGLAGPNTMIYPKEAVDKYGKDIRINPVGTGPFVLDPENVDEDIKIILTRNEKYYRVDEFGNKLPLLSAIDISFLKDKKTEMLTFKKQGLHMLYRLPTDDIINILTDTKAGSGEYGDYILQLKPEMASQVFGFLHTDPVFADVNVRKAFSFALDRERILEYVLQGEGDGPGIHGITPATFKGYATKEIKGYTLNADSARYYLAKAGFPNGKGFPKTSLDLNTEGERNTAVAIEVQKQIKDNLNLSIDINPMPIAQHSEGMQAGRSKFFRTGWLYDYPNPENFLMAFYSKNLPEDATALSFPNMWRYKNPKFDALYEQGLRATTVEQAYEYFLQAEQVLMNDAAVIVLWYDEGYRLLQPFVKNFPSNPMQYRDFSEVYLDGAILGVEEKPAS